MIYIETQGSFDIRVATEMPGSCVNQGEGKEPAGIATDGPARLQTMWAASAGLTQM